MSENIEFCACAGWGSTHPERGVFFILITLSQTYVGQEKE